MEYTSRLQEITEKASSPYSPINSPGSNGTNSNSSVCCSSNTTTTANNTTNNNHNNNSSNNNSSGVQIPTTPKLTSPRSDSNPYPTTFVQADTTNFKHVVQMLTGSSETVNHQSSPKPTTTHHHHPPHHHQDPTVVLPSSNKSFNIPPIKTAPPKKQGFKLYERRSTNLKNTLMINTLRPNFPHQASGFSPRHLEILSPSLLDFPSLTLSPATPLNDDPFVKSSSSPSLENSSSEEDRAIAEKGFYLHPSTRTTITPREAEPRLLPLFPVTSPRVSGFSS